MAENIIPLSYVVNATALTASQGLLPLQLGTILILTDEQPVNVLDGDYVLARTATSIGQAFGTESTTYKMANAIFAQNPNILNGDGYVVVAPYLTNAVLSPATAGTLTTVDLSSKLAALIQVTDGDLKITVDGGTAETITGLNFTSAETLHEVAAIINNE